jgi:regulator of protease activity HflC (stomatin/prohibitin superfamily)
MMIDSSALYIGFGFFALIAFIALITFLNSAVYLVRQAEVIVIERLGKFHRILTPGIHVVAPFLDRARQIVWTHVKESGDQRYYRYTTVTSRIDLREAVYDFPKQNVITRDNVTMEINALLYYQITDPKAAVYEVLNLSEAIEKLTQTTLRNVIGSLDLDESLVSRDMINERLRIILDEASDKWGVKINRVELQDVKPPADIRSAMEKQMRAERDRRAIILEFEGKKRAAILEAEGIRESQVLQAQGEAESRIIKTEAEARAIKMIQEASPKSDPLPYLIAMQYIKSMPEFMAGKNDKLVVVPYEASSLIGSLSTIKSVFKDLQ